MAESISTHLDKAKKLIFSTKLGQFFHHHKDAYEGNKRNVHNGALAMATLLLLLAPAVFIQAAATRFAETRVWQGAKFATALAIFILFILPVIGLKHLGEMISEKYQSLRNHHAAPNNYGHTEASNLDAATKPIYDKRSAAGAGEPQPERKSPEESATHRHTGRQRMA